MRPIPPAAGQQFGVFSTAQALRSGWTRSAVRHALDHGRLERVRPGFLAEPLLATGVAHLDAAARLRRHAAALSLANPRVPISHSAAAVLLELDLIDVRARVCMTYPRGHRGSVAGTHLHRARLFPGQVIGVRRLMVTSPARTVVDLGRELGVEAALVAVDSGLRRRLLAPADLDAALAVCAGWTGLRAAARAIALADPYAESALESISRLRIADSGMPPPQPQVRILTLNGQFCGRVDFYWDEFGIVGEADGFGKLDDQPLSLRDEKVRQGWMEDTGLSFVRWGWPDLDAFAPVAARLSSAFARGLRPDRAPRAWQALPPIGWTPSPGTARMS